MTTSARVDAHKPVDDRAQRLVEDPVSYIAAARERARAELAREKSSGQYRTRHRRSWSTGAQRPPPTRSYSGDGESATGLRVR